MASFISFRFRSMDPNNSPLSTVAESGAAERRSTADPPKDGVSGADRADPPPPPRGQRGRGRGAGGRLHPPTPRLTEGARRLRAAAPRGRGENPYRGRGGETRCRRLIPLKGGSVPAGTDPPCAIFPFAEIHRLQRRFYRTILPPGCAPVQRPPAQRLKEKGKVVIGIVLSTQGILGSFRKYPLVCLYFHQMKDEDRLLQICSLFFS